MKNIFITLALLINSSLFAQHIKIIESEAAVNFVFMDKDLEGTISDFKFTGKVNLDDLSNATFSGSVAVKTVDTNNWFRNGAIKRKLKFKKFPRLSFQSSEIQGSGKEFLVRGMLTIKGISKPVTFTFSKRPLSFYAGTVINLTDFGINIYKESERNMVQIRINLPYLENL